MSTKKNPKYLSKNSNVKVNAHGLHTSCRNKTRRGIKTGALKPKM